MEAIRRKGITRAISTALLAAVVIIIVVAAFAVYFLAVPQPSSTTSTTSTITTVPQGYKNTIVVGTTDSVATTIDPADAYDYFGTNVIYNLGDGLIDYRPGTSQYVPGLATSWSVSSNGTVWTFNLRQGVKFSDGTPFNATVVKYTMDRQQKIAEPEGSYVGAGIVAVFNRTIVTGPYQVKFVLNGPLSAFLGMVAFTAMYPVNPHVAPTNEIVNYTGNVKTENPNGLGPYTLTNWVRTAGKDIEMDWTANPSYWNASAGYPKTQNIIFKFYTDPTSLALALKNGEVDMAYRQLNPTDIQSFTTNSQYKVWTGPGTFIQMLNFNQKIPPLDNINVRRAIAAAVNRTAIVQNVFLGQAQNLYSMIPVGMSYHIDSYKIYSDANIALAQSYLQKAGYSTTNKLALTLFYPTGHYSSTDGIALQVKQALEATGMMTITLQSQPWASYRANNGNNQLGFSIYGWYPDYVDPYDYTYDFYPVNGVGGYHTNWVNTTMNSLVASLPFISTDSQFATVYGQIQTTSAQNVPYVPLFQSTSIAVSSPKVTGVVLDVTTIFHYSLLQETT